ncbi:MAG: hypothetical protein HOV77_32765 [Hamadaea sp.]|uniref:hypothetical protein n=1 Tax=Hamadaea sp. TaxID=2024425 RepID=UPI0017DF65FA|nr:hypothetical protein [Hamadaea sp.]NUT23960.1 hypothetical protein [Hamadaea sp.]
MARWLPAAVLFPVLLMTLWLPLNGDVQYALGGIEAAGRGGVSVWDVFVARPIAYRLFVGGLDGLRELFPGTGSWAAKNAIVRLETDLVIVLIGVALFLGLRRFCRPSIASVGALATTAALIVSPPWHFLQPDWVAALAGVLAVGAALAPKRLWLGAVLGGFATFLTLAVKLATAPIAAIAVLLIAVLCLRRAVWTAVAAVGFTGLWYVLTKQFLPWEWTWFADQAALVHNSPIHHAPNLADFRKFRMAMYDVMILSPIVVLAPAAVVVLARRKLRWYALAIVIAGLSVSSAYAQGEWFMYHFAVLPVLAAGVWGAAFGADRRARLPLGIGLVAVAVASQILLRQPYAWRASHLGLVSKAYLAVAVVLAVVLWFVTRRSGQNTDRTRWWTTAAGTAGVVIAMLPAALPASGYAFTGYNATVRIFYGYPKTTVEDLRSQIGADTPVLYLTFGNLAYRLENPTACRYPSPQWLQRGAYLPAVRDYPSYADNLRCLTEDTTARYVLINPVWFRVAGSSPQVRALLAAKFDCSDEARVPAPPGLLVCPARA